ncbi:MAG TPA: DUF2207 domain-containing protein [bacterium]|nr:DUF2207 domain-containing protein [bacterium]HPN34375.1 DUF2207 domain-containing protein [bacterium]
MSNIIKRRRHVRLVFILLLTSGSLLRAEEQERILNYSSTVQVRSDGSMQVMETIRVFSTGDRIRHGIYRSLPTRYRDRYGHRFSVPLSVKAAFRDGEEEKHHCRSENNGVHIYLGDENSLIDPGVHTYTLTYETRRQIGFFSSHDELYWNVTGNGWAFAIDTAAATVYLPAEAAASAIGWDGFTGVQGSREKSLAFIRQEDGGYYFTATRPLEPQEGLTIVLTWPKGMVRQPERKERWNAFFQDNLGFVVGLVGLVLVLAYYIFQWRRVGRDPAKGAIVPQFRPPHGMRPDAVRYLMRMKFDDKTFASFIVHMAVRGHLLIRKDKEVYSLTRKQAEDTLSQDEKKVLDALFVSTGRIDLKQHNHQTIRSAMGQLKKQLAAAYYNTYFRTNRIYFWPGVLLSALVLTASLFALRSPEAALMAAWVLFWSMGVIALVYVVFHVWRTVVLASSVRYASIATAVFVTLFALPFIAGELFGLVTFSQTTSPWTVLVFCATVFLNYFFYHLLKAPSVTGRRVMDQLEGFKMYLTATEQSRWDTFYPPDKTPALFEKYLPYALALDVEHEWSEQFARLFNDEQQFKNGLGWYQSGSWTGQGLTSFTSSFSSSFSSSISSASAAPGSSSGSGGGGSSGGGGGGGGGGGW